MQNIHTIKNNIHIVQRAGMVNQVTNKWCGSRSDMVVVPLNIDLKPQHSIPWSDLKMWFATSLRHKLYQFGEIKNLYTKLWTFFTVGNTVPTPPTFFSLQHHPNTNSAVRSIYRARSNVCMRAVSTLYIKKKIWHLMQLKWA